MDSALAIFQTACSDGQFPSDQAKNGDHFIIDDLLDYPNDDPTDGGVDAAMTGTSTDSTVTAVDTSCNSAAQPRFHPSDVGGSDGCRFSGEICDPYDDFADLEWLSNFVEESFSTTEDFQKLQPIQGYTKARTAPLQPETASSGPTLRPEKPVPAKARSKRSRAAPGNWISRLLVVSPAPPAMSSSSESDVKAKKAAVMKKKEVADSGGEGRRCLHCASDKTPQWRTGPMGPKTLCNACGVRYKSGRLVPEYRPASSPTFVLTKHSNSHRKVLELRRQKEMARAQQQLQPPPPPYLHHHHHHHHQNMINLDVSNGDDYLIHQHIGPDFRQLI